MVRYGELPSALSASFCLGPFRRDNTPWGWGPVPYSINVVSEPFGPAVVLALQPDTDYFCSAGFTITQMHT